jgi:uncharacterized BrkB/YihY/UPF0761 family membrane protein/membrane-associated phospholipid phosphatase
MASSDALPGAHVQNSVTEMDRAYWWNHTVFIGIAIALWVLGWLTFALAATVVHTHPGPWPVELAVTRTVQGVPYWALLPPFIDFFGTFNNPIPSGIGVGIVVTTILLMGWYRPAIFLALAVGVGNVMNNFLAPFVNRPRPPPALVHVDALLKYPSFPSGHTNNEMIFYGFLLFMSFTSPVRRWRYRWALIPLQVFAALNILMIGFSRVYGGEHWSFDTLGGYLEGALWLTLFIFLYQWTTSTLERRRAKKLMEQPAIATQVHQQTGETMQEKTLVYTVEEKSLEEVQVVEKEAKPYELLLIKCKEDWIHHLAQGLAFSYITAWVSGAFLVVGIVGLIQGKFDTQVRQVLTSSLGPGTPSQLSAFFEQGFGQALGIFTRSSPIAIGLTLVLAVLVASLFFALLESCFDVIYHLPPRPFLRRHLVAIVMLFLYLVPVTLGIAVAEAPRLLLSLLQVVQPGDTMGTNPTLRIAGIVASILISLLGFEFIYVMIPHRHITIRTLGRHIRNSWRGAVIATVATQLFLLVFPFFTLHFLGSYIGEVAFAAILLLYFYLTTLILLFGAEVNAFFAEGIHLPKHDIITQASRDEYR